MSDDIGAPPELKPCPFCGNTLAIRWTFYSLDLMTLVVDRYEEFTRATKRHKKQTNRFWSRMRSRESRMVEADVPLTEEVAEEAKKTFLAQLDRCICVGFQR